MKKIFVAILLLSFHSYGIAQTDSLHFADSAILPTYLKEVTVAATRMAMKTSSVPQQVSIFRAANIKMVDQPTMADVLAQSGEVQVQKSQLGGGSPILRGFEANKILLVIDGVRMNNCIYRTGHLQNIITVDPQMLSSIEVLAGPSAVLYGSDALGGVISMYTKEPVLSAQYGKVQVSGDAMMRYATASAERLVHAALNIGGKKMAMLTSISLAEYSDLKAGARSNRQFPDWGKQLFYVAQVNNVDSVIANKDERNQVNSGGYRQVDWLTKWMIRGHHLRQTFSWQLSTSTNINRYDRLTELNAAGQPKFAAWYYGPQQRMMAAWHLQFDICKWYDSGQITIAYQAVEESRHTRGLKSRMLNHRTERLKIGSVNADFLKSLGLVKLQYGAELTYNHLQSVAAAANVLTGKTSPLDTRYPDGGNNTQSYALYAGASWTVSARWIATAGGRLTCSRLHASWNDTSFFPFPFQSTTQVHTSATANAGIVWFATRATRVSAVVASAFRTPNIDDMGKVFESGNGTLIVPNPSLRPERTLNIELALHTEIKRCLYFHGAAWYTEYYDALGTDSGTFNGMKSIMYDGVLSQVVTTVNKARAFLWGANGGIAAAINAHWLFSSTISYTFGRIRETAGNYPLDHIPPLSGRCSIQASYGRFIASAWCLYNGAKKSTDYNLRGEDNQQYSADVLHGYTPGWITMNCRSSFQCSPSVKLQFAIENIFDQNYRTFASGIGSPGRNWLLSLSKRF